jgi:hypothetical protein
MSAVDADKRFKIGPGCAAITDPIEVSEKVHEPRFARLQLERRLKTPERHNMTAPPFTVQIAPVAPLRRSCAIIRAASDLT